MLIILKTITGRAISSKFWTLWGMIDPEYNTCNKFLVLFLNFVGKGKCQSSQKPLEIVILSNFGTLCVL